MDCSRLWSSVWILSWFMDCGPTNQGGQKKHKDFPYWKEFPKRINRKQQKNEKKYGIAIDIWNGPPTNGYPNTKYEHFLALRFFGNQNFWGTHLFVVSHISSSHQIRFLGGFKFQQSWTTACFEVGMSIDSGVKYLADPAVTGVPSPSILFQYSWEILNRKSWLMS